MESKKQKIEALLSGDIRLIAEASGKKSRFLPLPGCVFTFTPDGKYSGSGYTDLSKEEIMKRTTQDVLFFLPDNGR